MHVSAGDTVAFSVNFLRSISDYSANSANRRGTVTEIEDFGGGAFYCTVDWQDGSKPMRVHGSNLIRADRVGKELP